MLTSPAAPRYRAAARLALASTLLGLASACATTSPTPAPGPEQPPLEEGWIALFDGKSLAGWTPKFAGSELGANPGDTFRVEDGLLKVAYDQWDGFEGQFGHLIHDHPYDHYRLRVEYRFVGEQVPGGPGWAWRNSGIMVHGQDPATMTLDQSFPVSIEVQLLGGGDTGERTTANLCTPGTHVEFFGELVERHCTDSRSATYRGDVWTTVEVDVRGNELIRHLIDGVPVLEYGAPQLDRGDADAQRLLEAGAPRDLDHGYISLQAESHPVEFRRVELLPL